jgi:hypothetical protein
MMRHPRRITTVRKLAGLSIGVCALTLLGLLTSGPAPAGTPARLTDDSTLEEALGKHGRAEFAATLARRSYGGKTHEWRAYADWGRELLTKGSVSKPPEGRAPSPALSAAYRCVHCHNLVREDAKLTTQDPEAREQLIRAKSYADPARRDGSVLSMTPGTTLWGAVNRESFYNGYYTKYHDLEVNSGVRMSAAKLCDAIQICCRFCSVGRFPEPWELDSLVAALWDLELRVKDLNLPEAQLAKILADLRSEHVTTAADARVALKDAYLRTSAATQADLPSRSTLEFDEYGPGNVVRGDAGAGKLLYASACAGCHNRELDLPEGRGLGASAKAFHRYVWHGTERHDALYMPFFSKERLSPRQAADIRAYLRSLPRQ